MIRGGLIEARKKSLKLCKTAKNAVRPKEEPYAICYYLCVLLGFISNGSIIEYLDDSIGLFLSAVDSLKKKTRLEKILQKETERLVQVKLLVPFEDSESEMTFGVTEIPYKYKIDRKIDRNMNNSAADESFYDILRILYVHKKPVLKNIIASTIFYDDDDFSIRSEFTLSKKWKMPFLTSRK